MQELGDNTIQRVDWQNVFPVVLLPRAYKFALGGRVIFLALLGLVLTVPFLPWYGSNEYDVVNKFFAVKKYEIAFTPNSKLEFQPVRKQLATPKLAPVAPLTFDKYEPNPASENFVPGIMVHPCGQSWDFVPRNLMYPWTHLTATGYAAFTRTKPSTLGWLAITLFIWAWLGGMITRIVALRFAQDRRESFTQLFGFVRAKWLSYVGAIVLPMIGIFLALLPIWLIGWIWQFLPPAWGFDLAHLILAFPFALVTVLMAIGVMFGWPLMFAAVSAEGSDAFDAVSRGFSYVYQRPMQFVFYHLCNLVIYAIGIIIAYFVFHQTVTLIGYSPAGLMILFNSFAFAYFWSAQTVIYFLLRRSCDATPINQVYLADVKKRTLPPFVFGKNGEPELK